MILATVFSSFSSFFSFLSTTYLVPGLSLLNFIVSCFVVSIVIYVVLPFGGDDD